MKMLNVNKEVFFTYNALSYNYPSTFLGILLFNKHIQLQGTNHISIIAWTIVNNTTMYRKKAKVNL